MMTKEQMAEAILALPDDATIDDAIERLEVIKMIERGIAAAEAGQKVSQEEAQRRMAHWLP